MVRYGLVRHFYGVTVWTGLFVPNRVSHGEPCKSFGQTRLAPQSVDGTLTVSERAGSLPRLLYVYKRANSLWTPEGNGAVVHSSVHISTVVHV